jgi:hypothetical protein
LDVNKVYLVVLISVLAIGAAMVIRRIQRPAELSFTEKIAYFQNEAVSMAKQSYGITLDYSPASIRDVESILGKLHDDYQKHRTADGQRGLALAYGAYIGEVIRRETGEGRWAPDDPKFGVGTMPLYWLGRCASRTRFRRFRDPL